MIRDLFRDWSYPGLCAGPDLADAFSGVICTPLVMKRRRVRAVLPRAPLHVLSVALGSAVGADLLGELLVRSQAAQRLIDLWGYHALFGQPRRLWRADGSA